MPSALRCVNCNYCIELYGKKIWCPCKQHDNDLQENVFFVVIVFNKTVL